MAADDQATATWPQAFLVVDAGTDSEREVAVHDVLVVGRECSGVDDSRRLLIDDETVSRRHVEIRLDLDADCAYVFDTSTNGTRLNDGRIERGTEVPIRPGDRLTVGSVDLEFRAERFLGDVKQRRSTVVRVSLSKLAMVAGDILSYSTISQYTDDDVLLKSVDQLYRELRQVLDDHRGSLNHYVGDAFFAVWESEHDPKAVRNATGFAIAAAKRVSKIAPKLALRTPEGDPIRMGWGVEVGQAAVSPLPGKHMTVLGDATNLAFRLSGLAGRDGRAEVLVTDRVATELGDEFAFGAPEEVTVKGRRGAERVYGVKERPRRRR